MENNQPLTFTLAQEELYVVLASLDSQIIPGLDNQWQKELNPTNLSMALDIAMRCLIARGLCQPSSDLKSINFRPAVTAMIGVCAQPEVSLTLFIQQDKQPVSEFYFHYAKTLFVAHTIPYTGIHSFVAFRSQAEFTKAFQLAAKIPEAAGGVQNEVEITLSGLEKAREAAGREDAEGTLRELMAAGMEAGLAKNLAETLAGHDFSLSISRQKHATNESDSLTLVGKAARLWMFGKGTRDDCLTASAVSVEQANLKLNELAILA